MTTVVHILAHYDDEYAALPLILALDRQGLAQRFVFMTEPVRGATGEVRRAESLAFLASLGLTDMAVVHLGRDLDIPDQGLLELMAPALQGLLAAAAGFGEIAGLDAPAWEGGHVDHDLCAALAVLVASRLPGRPPVSQFGLYNGRGAVWPLFRAANALPENGPAERVGLSATDWLAYAAAVRFFPSQAAVWSTLWPGLFASFLGHGFRRQSLAPQRIRERPHLGQLLYERRGQASYAQVAHAIDRLSDARPNV